MGKFIKRSSWRPGHAGRKSRPGEAEREPLFSVTEGEARKFRSRLDFESLLSSVLMVADGGVGHLT